MRIKDLERIMVKKYFHGYFYDLVIEASQFKI